jgi:hypothetical protein
MSGVKNVLQQRHLRRLCLELIVCQAGRKPDHPINQKPVREEDKKPKKEEKFSRRILKKIRGKKK